MVGVEVGGKGERTLNGRKGSGRGRGINATVHKDRGELPVLIIAWNALVLLPIYCSTDYDCRNSDELRCIHVRPLR